MNLGNKLEIMNNDILSRKKDKEQCEMTRKPTIKSIECVPIEMKKNIALSLTNGQLLSTIESYQNSLIPKFNSPEFVDPNVVDISKIPIVNSSDFVCNYLEVPLNIDIHEPIGSEFQNSSNEISASLDVFEDNMDNEEPSNIRHSSKDCPEQNENIPINDQSNHYDQFNQAFTLPNKYLPKMKRIKIEASGKPKLPSAGTSDQWLHYHLEKERQKEIKEEKLKRKKELQEQKKKIAEKKKILQEEIKEIHKRIKQETQ